MTAEQEFHALLTRLTAEQRAALRERIESGRIEGDWFWDHRSQCGCIYGTALVLTGYQPVEGITMYPEIETRFEKRDLSNSLETFTEYIHEESTPANNERSAQLIAWMDAFERTAVPA